MSYEELSKMLQEHVGAYITVAGDEAYVSGMKIRTSVDELIEALKEYGKKYEIWRDGCNITLISVGNHSAKRIEFEFDANAELLEEFEADTGEDALRTLLKWTEKEE